MVTGDLESACDERNFTYGPIRPWDGAVIHLDASAGVASVSHITDTQIDVSAHSQTQALESAAARTLPVGTTTSGIGPVSTDVESIPTSSWNSPSSSRMLTDTVHSFESTLPNLNVTKVSHAATTSSATFQLPQPSPRPPTPSKVSKSVSPTTIGAGVGAPIAGIAFLLLAFFLIRKQAEKKSKEPAKQEEPPRWSKPLLDSTTIHELNGRDTVQELDSKPIGAIEIGSNQIYEATGSEPRTAR